MKGMPLPFDFEGKGVLDLDLILKNQAFFFSGGDCSSSDFGDCFVFSNGVGGEPTSVLDPVRTPSQLTSSSTLSSSLGGGGGGVGGGGAGSSDTAAVGFVSDANKWQNQDSTTATSTNAGVPDSGLLPIPSSLEIGASSGENPQRFGMEDWDAVLSESAAVSPSQEQSILRWFMGDVEDPALTSLNKVLQSSAAGIPPPEFDFSGGYGSVDQGFGGDHLGVSFPVFPISNSSRSSGEKLGFFSPNSVPSNLPSNFKLPHNSGFQNQIPFDSSTEMKPQIFSSSLLMNQHSQNPSFLLPFSYPQQQEEPAIVLPPQAKRQNCDAGVQIPKGPFLDTGQQELYMGRLPLTLQPQIQLQRHSEEKRKLAPVSDSEHCHQQATVDQLHKAAELLHSGNLVLAHGILARLNHQLSPIGKPFQRAAFYCKEALQLLLHCISNNIGIPYPNNNPLPPVSLFLKLGAYKSFSEISPLVQFANFTSNQAILEAFEGFERVRIVDFDIGYGGQWASLMQELAVRSGGAPTVKITAFVSPMTHDQLELGLTRENLIRFASEINVSVEFEVMGIDSLSSGTWLMPENEAVAVNLPAVSLSNYQFSSAPLVLRFVKQLSPRIVVAVERGCDRTDLSFANVVIHAFQYYTSLMESLEAAVNVPMDTMQKIERFLLQPGLEKVILGRFRCSSEKTQQHWRSMFLSAGFSPVTLSTFTEAQAECIIKRTCVGGFQVDKRQSSLLLCWQRKELVSASAWRCC